VQQEEGEREMTQTTGALKGEKNLKKDIQFAGYLQNEAVRET